MALWIILWGADTDTRYLKKGEVQVRSRDLFSSNAFSYNRNKLSPRTGFL
jgi:hypothetical protein